MIGELFKVGDRVTIVICKENRDWGYNPCEDGTEATVTGFSTITYGRINNFGYGPGVYVNHAWITVKTDDGKEWSEWSGRLTMVDEEEYKRRVAVWREKGGMGCKEYKTKLRDIPETEFYEGDKVACAEIQNRWEYMEGGSPKYLRIANIHFEYMKEDGTMQKCNDGVTDMPLYDVSPEDSTGCYTSTRPDDLTLIERGNVWKWFHDEPLSFKDLSEEASFYRAIGRTEEVRNPASNNYAWTKDEILDAIRDGRVHGFSVSGPLFGFAQGPEDLHHHAIRFLDEEVGKRVAAATLEGFKAAA